MASSKTAKLPSIAHLRLASQRLVASELATPAEVVRHLLAVQAQDFPGAKWSVGLRAPGLVDADVVASLERAEIVRSWPMRGTLHFTLAEDLPWMLALSTPRLVAGAARRREQLGLDEAQLEQAREICVDELSRAGDLSRDELLARVASRGVSTDKQRGYHILWHLSQTGTLCFGPPRDKEQTFVLLERWIKKPRSLERDEALGELATRYFRGHGPATVADLVGWAKLTAGEAKTAVAVAGKALRAVDSGGQRYLMEAKSEGALSAALTLAPASVLALPGFDEYLLGYKARGDVLPEEHADRIVPGGNGMFLPTVVVGGQVVGTWKRTARKKVTLVEAAPFGRMTAAARAGFAKAASAWGRFWGVEVEVVTR